MVATFHLCQREEQSLQPSFHNGQKFCSDKQTSAFQCRGLCRPESQCVPRPMLRFHPFALHGPVCRHTIAQFRRHELFAESPNRGIHAHATNRYRLRPWGKKLHKLLKIFFKQVFPRGVKIVPERFNHNIPPRFRPSKPHWQMH